MRARSIFSCCCGRACVGPESESVSRARHERTCLILLIVLFVIFALLYVLMHKTHKKIDACVSLLYNVIIVAVSQTRS